MLKKIERVRDWLLHKSPEIMQLTLADALLAKIVLRIRQDAFSRSFVVMPLNAIRPIHPIDRQTAQEKVVSRIKALSNRKQEILKNGNHLANQVIEECMPSICPIQVISHEDHFLAFEGNGRLQALQQVFTDGNTTIEVEVFSVREQSAIRDDIARLLEMRRETL